MPDARPPRCLAGASEIVLTAEGYASADHSSLVATVGSLTVSPNVPNVVPGDVAFTLDVRHRDDTHREAAVAAVLDHAHAIAEKRGLLLTIEREQHFPAVPMDPAYTDLLRSVAHRATGIEPLRLSSGAGHDAAVFAPLTPTALLFVRSPNGGLSHHPDEAVFPHDVRDAVAALVAFVAAF